MNFIYSLLQQKNELCQKMIERDKTAISVHTEKRFFELETILEENKISMSSIDDIDRQIQNFVLNSPQTERLKIEQILKGHIDISGEEYCINDLVINIKQSLIYLKQVDHALLTNVSKSYEDTKLKLKNINRQSKQSLYKR